MYCRNCSNEVSDQAIACPKCGVPPKKGKNFCFNCANPTNPEAIICVNCGVSLATSIVPSIDKRKYLSLWGKYSYSTYVVILLLSLLPFVNITCNQTKVYTLTGFDLTVGKVRHYTKTVDLGMYGSYDKEKTETISNIYIQLFYVVIIAILIIVLAKIRKRFRYAQWGTLIGLGLLIVFVVEVNRRMNDSPSPILDLSYGSGYWLTILMLIISLIIILFYRKEFKKDEEITFIPPSDVPPISESAYPVKGEIQTAPSYDEIFLTEKRNVKKYLFILIPLIAIAAVIYFLATEKTPGQSVPNPETSSTVQQPMEGNNAIVNTVDTNAVVNNTKEDLQTPVQNTETNSNSGNFIYTGIESAGDYTAANFKDAMGHQISFVKSAKLQYQFWGDDNGLVGKTFSLQWSTKDNNPYLESAVMVQTNSETNSFIGCWSIMGDNKMEIKPEGKLIIHRLDLGDGQDETGTYKLKGNNIIFYHHFFTESQYFLTKQNNKVVLKEIYPKEPNIFFKIICN